MAIGVLLLMSVSPAALNAARLQDVTSDPGPLPAPATTSHVYFELGARQPTPSYNLSSLNPGGWGRPPWQGAARHPRWFNRRQ